MPDALLYITGWHKLGDMFEGMNHGHDAVMVIPVWHACFEKTFRENVCHEETLRHHYANTMFTGVHVFTSLKL